MQNEYSIFGTVIQKGGEQKLVNLIVQAWDRDFLRHDFLGEAITDKKGGFVINFNDSFFVETPYVECPDLFFRVFMDTCVVLDTIKTPVKNVKPGKTEVILEVEPSAVTGFKLLKIASLETLMTNEKEILGRIEKVPNGGNLFMINPLMLLRDLGVLLSDDAEKELVDYEPSFKALSTTPYNALKNSKSPQKVRFHVKSLFRKEVQ